MIKLNKFNPNTGKLVFRDKEYSFGQLQEISKVFERVNFLPLDRYEDLSKLPLAHLSQAEKEEIKRIKNEAGELKVIRSIALDTKLSHPQLTFLNQLLLSPLTSPQLKVVFSSSFSLPQMNIVAASFLAGLDMKEVKVIANSKLETSQMEWLKNKFIEGGSIEALKVLADPKYSLAEMEVNYNAWLSDISSLTPEAQEEFLKAKMLESYKNSLIDTDIQIVTKEGIAKFYLGDAEIDKANLEQFLGKGGDEEAMISKKKYLLNPSIKPDIKVILDFAITADLGEMAYQAIAHADSLQTAKDQFTTHFRSLTGRDIEFGRDLDADKRDKLYKIDLDNKEVKTSQR